MGLASAAREIPQTSRHAAPPPNMASRIPPLLQPYVQLPPPDSLTLVSGVLGASTNWLLLRYLCGALGDGGTSVKRRGGGVGRAADENQTSDIDGEHAKTEALENEGVGQGEEVAVVLVSWMRDFEFWRVEGRRACVCIPPSCLILSCKVKAWLDLVDWP